MFVIIILNNTTDPIALCLISCDFTWTCLSVMENSQLVCQGL